MFQKKIIALLFTLQSYAHIIENAMIYIFRRDEGSLMVHHYRKGGNSKKQLSGYIFS
jgi:hypothetical protein